MPSQDEIDWVGLWQDMASRFVLGAHSIHGVSHWKRVEQHAVVLVEKNGGDILVVRLFAVFHDVCRINEGRDNDHGARGAALAAQLRGTAFELADDQFEQFHYACTWHTIGHVSDDPTIGACWDADRLDLWRVGSIPAAAYMSTEYGRELVRAGHVGPEFTPRIEL